MKIFLQRSIALLAAILLLASCSGGQKAVAKVNDAEILNDEFQQWMKYYMSNAGIEIPADYGALSDEEKDQIEEMREQALEYLINNRVELQKAKEDGLDQLTEAELADVNDEVEYTMNSWYDAFTSEVAQEGELGGEAAANEAIKRYNAFIKETGYNKEFVTDTLKKQAILAKLQDKYYAQLEPDEEQLRAKYEERVTSEKERYAENPDIYADDIAYSTPLYNPAGFRRISHILLSPTDEQQEEIYNLQTEGKEDEAEAKQAEYMEQAKEKADEVYKELTENGKAFEAAMKEYSTDLDYYGELNQPEGYILNANTTNLVPEFISGGMALAKTGDISQPIKTDYGYHILRYEEDIKEATTPFEEVPTEIIDEFKSEIQYDGYEKLKSEWRAGMTVETYLDNIVYPTPTPSPTPEPTPTITETSTPAPTETATEAATD